MNIRKNKEPGRCYNGWQLELSNGLSDPMAKSVYKKHRGI